MSLRTTVVAAVVGACLAVPLALVAVAAVSAHRQAIEAQVDRGQQLATTAATLQAVARQSGSAADRAVLGQFLRAVVVGDVAFVIVTASSPAGTPETIEQASLASSLANSLANSLGASLGDTDAATLLQTVQRAGPAGFVVVDAAIVERDRTSRAEAPAGRVVVGLHPAPRSTARVTALFVIGAIAVVVVVLLLLWLLERRVIRPVQSVARALQQVADGGLGLSKTAPPLLAPQLNPHDEVAALVDGYHALVQALADKGALQSSLSRAAGAQVAQHIDNLDAAPVTSSVSVLFVDVRDFTPLTAALSPADTITFLDTLLSAFVDVVHRHGGHVERFLADGLVAVWGAPQPVADHAARAVAAAVDLEARAAILCRRAREDGRPTFVIGVGVASGNAVTGGVGPPSRRTFAVTGEVPQTARRIQGEAKAQGLTVLVTEQTWAACKDVVVDVRWQKTPPMVVRGIGMPLTLYRPQRVDPVAGSGLAGHPHPGGPRADVTQRIRR